MKKAKSKIFAVIIAIIVISLSAVIAVSAEIVRIPWADVAEWKAEQGIGANAPAPDSETSLKDWAYSIATSEQAKALDEIYSGPKPPYGDDWQRSVLIAIGSVSADTPRLTLDNAASIYQDVKKRASIEKSAGQIEHTLVEEFNKVAGAPDWEGGSGIYRYCYYLDDEHSEAIFVWLGGIDYILFDEEGNGSIGAIPGVETPKPYETQTPN